MLSVTTQRWVKFLWVSGYEGMEVFDITVNSNIVNGNKRY